MLHPDPGTGRHWRISLRVAGEDLYCDVATRAERDEALRVAEVVARALGLSLSGEDQWTPGDASRGLAMLAWFAARGASNAGQWPGDPDDFAKQIMAREEFDAWWSRR